MNKNYTFDLTQQETMHLLWCLEDILHKKNPIARHMMAVIKDQIAKQDNERHGGNAAFQTDVPCGDCNDFG